MSTTHASAVAADAAHERSYDVPGLLEELGTDDFPQAVRAAYWLGVHRAHARAIDRDARYASDEKARTRYAEIRDSVARNADNARGALKAALASEREEWLSTPPFPSHGPRIVAEFDCAKDAREYAKAHGYTVTAGVNRLFAVWGVAP